MFTFTTPNQHSKATVSGAARKRFLRRFATIVVGIAAFSALESMPRGAGDEFPFGAPTSPDAAITRTVASPQIDNSDLPGKPDDEAFYFGDRNPHHGDRDLVAPPLTAPDRRPIPQHRTQSRLSESERTQRKLTSRYGNPMTVQMVRSMGAEQSLNFYREVSRLIDARHLEPSSYERRVERALWSLRQALSNEAFRRANGVTNDSALAAFRRELPRVSDEPIADETAAEDVLRRAMQSANNAGVAPGSVALEFVCGATDTLDPFSAFIPPTRQGDSLVELEGHIVGIGVEIASDDDGLRIVKALPNSPASEAGLRTGDIIESVDGREMAGVMPDSAANLIAGRPGSQVTLRVRRDTRIAQFALQRREVELHSVSDVKMLDRNVGYLKLEKFAETSSDEIDRALSQLSEREMRSLILDLRGNPGGLLTSAVAVSSKFLGQGPIVATRGRNPEDNTVEYSRGNGATDIRLVVLVDEESASASEIFAAAMQDNERALVVGRRTFGKGTVQTHFPLRTVSGDLSLTSARFVSPRGRLIHGEGVVPDVLVAVDRTKSSELSLHERSGDAWVRDPDVAAGYAAATNGYGRERSHRDMPGEGRVLTVTDVSFARLVESSERPLVVEFWAPWCPQCRIVTPIIDELATKWEGRVQFAKMEVGPNPEIVARYHIGNLPVLVVLIGGREVERVVGVDGKAEIVRRLESAAARRK